ncbi:MAG: hypothetical protein GY830_05855 [Bacteroidetes bacterium]|nr:hypothetical protein [Bacteroidota bacterium]
MREFYDEGYVLIRAFSSPSPQQIKSNIIGNYLDLFENSFVINETQLGNAYNFDVTTLLNNWHC